MHKNITYPRLEIWLFEVDQIRILYQNLLWLRDKSLVNDNIHFKDAFLKGN